MSNKGGGNGHDTWDWQEITLLKGPTIRVRAIPPHLSTASMASVVLPKPPIIEIKATPPLTGVERRENPSDLDYQRAYEEAVNKRSNLAYIFQYSWGIECEVPSNDEWKHELEEYLPNITWAEGTNGRKADYVRYVLLQYPQDFDRVHRALSGEREITQEEVEAVQDSFRDS